MPTRLSDRTSRAASLTTAFALVLGAMSVAGRSLEAQQGRGGPTAPLRQAEQLDREGKTAQARAIYQAVLDTASDPATKADLQRAMAMSYAFDGDCAKTLEYEQMAIDYWKTREQADPQHAFYQEGELADEGARVCVDVGDLNRGEDRYRKGYVALYTGELQRADSALSAAVALRGNERDPFMHCLLAMTYEREGKAADARAMYRKAYDLATAHNPPSAFVRRYAGEKVAPGGS